MKQSHVYWSIHLKIGMSNVINIDDIFNSSSIKKIQKIKAIDLLGRSICECETQEEEH